MGACNVLACGRQWREGRIRPLQGNAPPDRPVSRGIRSFRSVCDPAFSATFPLQRTIPGRPDMRFLRHGGIYPQRNALAAQSYRHRVFFRHQISGRRNRLPHQYRCLQASKSPNMQKLQTRLKPRVPMQRAAIAS